MYSNKAIDFKEYYINTHNRWLILLFKITENPTLDWGSEFQELVNVTMELFLNVRKFCDQNYKKIINYCFFH